MNIKIKSRFDDRILYECEADSVADALKKAIIANADLSSADLSSADLSSADLRSADLRYADLRSADLRSADLRSADLHYADLRYADLSSADLRSADLRYADLLIYQTDIWTCYIQPDMIRIGCQYHKQDTWNNYSDADISKMEPRALEWWKRHKAAIFAIHATFANKENQQMREPTKEQLRRLADERKTCETKKMESRDSRSRLRTGYEIA